MRKLSRLRGEGYPRRLLFLDTETLPRSSRKRGVQVHRLRLGVCIAGSWDGSELSRREVFRFTDPAAFWLWVAARLSKRCVTWLYAHNLAFDLQVTHFWQGVISGDFRAFVPAATVVDPETGERTERKAWQGPLVLEKRPYFAGFQHQRGRLNVCDTLNYWDMPLAELGKAIGRRKLALPPWKAPDRSWLRYCLNDAQIIEQAVTSLLREWKALQMGPWKMSAPALAMSSFQAKFLPRPLDLHAGRLDELRKLAQPTAEQSAEAENIKACLSLERQAFYGGRVECYFYGDVSTPGRRRPAGQPPPEPANRPQLRGPLYYLDVRSLYPSVMWGRRYPVRLLARWTAPDRARWADLARSGDCLATCLIGTVHRSYPVRTDDGLIYPVGRYWTTLPGPELTAAAEEGSLEDVGELIHYQTADLFTDFVSFWWGRRLDALRDGRADGQLLAKLILNSLYGKFAQRRGRWVNAPGVNSPIPWGPWSHRDPDTGQPRNYRSIGWHTQQQGEREDSPRSFPAIAAWVTSYGRLTMRRFIEALPARSLVYTDTDSLIVTQEGKQKLESMNMVRPDTLGGLRIVSEHMFASLYGVRNYCVDGVDVVAGVKSRALRVGPRTWRQPQFEGADSLARRDPDGTVRVSDQVLTLPGGPRGQWVDSAGWAQPVALGF